VACGERPHNPEDQGLVPGFLSSLFIAIANPRRYCPCDVVFTGWWHSMGGRQSSNLSLKRDRSIGLSFMAFWRTCTLVHGFLVDNKQDNCLMMLLYS
jgi:hypothetical protein